jgi:hypothetical protein
MAAVTSSPKMDAIDTIARTDIFPSVNEPGAVGFCSTLWVRASRFSEQAHCYTTVRVGTVDDRDPERDTDRHRDDDFHRSDPLQPARRFGPQPLARLSTPALCDSPGPAKSRPGASLAPAWGLTADRAVINGHAQPVARPGANASMMPSATDDTDHWPGCPDCQAIEEWGQVDRSPQHPWRAAR